jgi:alpha/beta superfamily hydrolase
MDALGFGIGPPWWHRPLRSSFVDAITLRTDDGLTLEGVVHRPDASAQAKANAVVCHPHPEHGGSKDHPLLWAIRISLVKRGFVVVTFNFRGVMGSEGSYSAGVEEVRDVAAAVTVARKEQPGPTFVAGWSFGANVALRAAFDDERIDALALIGFPLSERRLMLPEADLDALRAFDRPVLLVSGSEDPYSPTEEVLTMAGRLRRSTVEIVREADHFFPRREREVGELVGAFAEATLLGEA